MLFDSNYNRNIIRSATKLSVAFLIIELKIVLSVQQHRLHYDCSVHFQISSALNQPKLNIVQFMVFRTISLSIFVCVKCLHVLTLEVAENNRIPFTFAHIVSTQILTHLDYITIVNLQIYTIFNFIHFSDAHSPRDNLTLFHYIFSVIFHLQNFFEIFSFFFFVVGKIHKTHRSHINHTPLAVGHLLKFVTFYCN